MEHVDEKSTLMKYTVGACLILAGSVTSVLIANQKKRLGWIANTAIFLCGAIVGTVYWIYTKGSQYNAGTSIVSIFGYQIVKAIGFALNDPKMFKEIIKDKISKW